MEAVICHWDNPASFTGGKSLKKALLHYMTTAKSFGVGHVIMVDPVGDCPLSEDQEMTFELFTTLDEPLTKYSDVTHIYADSSGDDFETFVHPPSDVIYIFGGDYSGLVIPEGASVVSIPCDIEGIYSFVAMGIILANRFKRR